MDFEEGRDEIGDANNTYLMLSYPISKRLKITDESRHLSKLSIWIENPNFLGRLEMEPHGQSPWCLHEIPACAHWR
jgi:hypothetical protein